MMNELDRVVLTVDLPELDLKAGDIGAIVFVYEKGKAFEVEFVALDGETIGVETLEANQLRPVNAHEVASARTVVSH